MKDFNEFITSLDASLISDIMLREAGEVKESKEQARRNVADGYFDALKQIIDGVGGLYFRGDRVMSIIGEKWHTVTNELKLYCNVTIFARNKKNGAYGMICSINRMTCAGLLNIRTLKEIMEAEGLRVFVKEKQNNVYINVYAIGK